MPPDSSLGYFITVHVTKLKKKKKRKLTQNQNKKPQNLKKNIVDASLFLASINVLLLQF